MSLRQFAIDSQSIKPTSSRRLTLLSLLIIFSSFSLFAEDLYLPHYTFVGGRWSTEISLANPTAKAINVHIQAYDVDGQSLAAKEFQIPAMASLRGDIQTLFPELTAESGWFRVSSDQTDLNGLVRFTAVNEKGSSSLPLTGQVGTRLTMPLIENNEQWAGGLAVINTSNQDAALEIDVYAADGRRLARKQTSLAAHAKWVAMLADTFSAEELDSQNTIIISADRDITGFALNFAPGVSQIVAVPGSVVAGQASRLVEDLTSLAGSWRRIGYDEYIVINQTTLFYNESPSGDCNSNSFALPLEDLYPDFLTAWILPDGRLYFLTNDGEPLFFEPGTGPQIDCDYDDNPDQDPFTNYNALWDILDKHYAFFEVHNVDPQALRTHYQSQISAQTTPQQLAEIIGALLYELDDIHTSLETPYGDYESGNPRGYRQELLSNFQNQSEYTDFDSYLSADVNQWFQVLVSYLDDQPIFLSDGTGIVAGHFNDRPEVGYLAVTQMSGYSDDGDLSVELATVNHNLDQAFAHLGDVDAIVVDVRYNGGGYDLVSRAIAERFAATTRRAYSKAALDGEAFSPYQSIWLDPYQGGARFDGDQIVLLTSELTASAAEIFTMSLRALPNLTHVGEPTAGGLSDILTKELPNGWSINLSNEKYLDREGRLWEGPGIQPEVMALHYRNEDKQAGRDSALETALAQVPQ